MRRITAAVIGGGIMAGVCLLASLSFDVRPVQQLPQESRGWPRNQAEFDSRSWRDLNKPGYPVHGSRDNLTGPYQQPPLGDL